MAAEAAAVASAPQATRYTVSTDDCVFSIDTSEVTRLTDGDLPPHTEAFYVERNGRRVIAFVAHSTAATESLSDLTARRGMGVMRDGSMIHDRDTVHAANDAGTTAMVQVANANAFDEPNHQVTCEGNNTVEKSQQYGKDGCHFVAWGDKAFADEVIATCKSVRISRVAPAADAAAKALARKSREGDSRALLTLLY